MAVLGKRKARAEPSVSEEDAAAIFRRHFEEQFSPLPSADAKSKSKASNRAEDADELSDDSEENDDVELGEDESDDEWGGLSGNESSEEEEVTNITTEEASTVEVVDHSHAQPSKTTQMSKRELKAFMSSRPPDQTFRAAEPSTTTTTSSIALPEDAPSLLAQDLELRRLISESHLLAPAVTATGASVAPKAFAAGRTRHKATDLRVQALGSKVSVHKQDKMPMNMRKGIVAAAGARETKRRREAKENGVILERETGNKKKRRERGGDPAVDRPGVGRLKGAELRLNDRDVKKIQESRDVFGRRGRR
ncbi:hypothetical protein FZEAL_10762 [Fusarium zealandicum]|uniref:Protein FAF1 n=1 Tax=Fusarium zealandicum TaxID=1053134 RepID=A0A8H4TWF8_9HYPO|nr:hypothetical protein FZEAL_10762 [Fusarium zealandicum]